MASQNSYSITEIISFIREKLIKQGYHAIRIIGKNLREMKSYDGYNKIDKDEFLFGLRDLGILLPKVAAEKLVKNFDLDIDGYVYIEEFLEAIRDRPNELRQNIIDRAFNKFDKDNSGYVNIRDLKGIFNCSLHPKVIEGTVTEVQAFDEFIRNFNDRFGSGKIDRYEWNDYYSAVSYCVGNDEHFEKIVKTVWQLD